jgi:crotonobetainyl-CoA:carnitine CoA-transferase CaiB-like acyl-CoA transferase
MRRAMGPAGEHNAEILRSVGYPDAEIAALHAAKIV